MSIIHFESKTYNVKKMHTKQLLNLLRDIHLGPFCECCYDPDWVYKRLQEAREIDTVLKAELATREHVPNKQEAKAIRKQKAVQQRNMKNKKYRNR